MKKIKKEIWFEILAIILIAFFAFCISPKTLQNDTFYTVTIGKQIVENGIDMQDHFSWHSDLPYTYPHWLYDVGMYLIYNLGSWQGIYISTCILAIILGISIYKVNSRLTKSKVMSFLITIGSLYLLKGYIAARAQLVTFILFIWLVYNIEKFIKNKKIVNVFSILGIHILIANLHVAVWPFTFVLYLPYIGEYLVAELIDIVLYKKVKIWKLSKKKNSDIEKIQKIKEKVEIIKTKREENKKNIYKLRIEKNKNVRWLILIMIVALFTGFITPLGTVPYTYTYLTLVGNTMKSINEHLPLTLINNIPILCTIVIFLMVLTFTKVKIRLSDLFMIGGLTYLMFDTRRQASMFALIGTIVLTRLIVEIIEIYSRISLKEIFNKFCNFFTTIVITLLVLILGFSIFSKKKNDKYINESTYPVKAAEWILENLDVNNIKMFNEYNYGSYLLYKGIPVFVDSRADLYAPEFNKEQDIFSDFINTSGISKYYGDTFKEYGITHVILYKNSKINMLIQKADSEKYKLIYPENDDDKEKFVIYEVLSY